MRKTTLKLSEQHRYSDILLTEAELNSTIFKDDKMIIENHVITSKMKNRNGQVVDPNGMNNKDYVKNPVVLFNHGNGILFDDDPPVAKSLAQRIVGYKIFADTQFNKLQTSIDIYNLNREGFLNAWSIGYLPTDKTYNESDKNDDTVYINKWDLLEYSTVTIPANVESLNNALSIVKSEDSIKMLVNNYKNEFLQIELNKFKNEFEGKYITNEILENKLKLITEKYNDMNLKFKKVNKILATLQINELKRVIKNK